MKLALYFLLLLAGFETGDARCDSNNNIVNTFGGGSENGLAYRRGGWVTPMSPEKRAVRSNIVFKGLLTHRHKPDFARSADKDEFVGEFLVLDVYKGAEKLGAQMGFADGGGGPGGFFGLRDQ